MYLTWVFINLNAVVLHANMDGDFEINICCVAKVVDVKGSTTALGFVEVAVVVVVGRGGPHSARQVICLSCR